MMLQSRFLSAAAVLMASICLTACGLSTPPTRTDVAEPYAATHSKLPDGIRLVERVDTEPGKLVIPYEKYRLANGLTVILHHDSSDPLVHVDVTYHVGSAREQPGKTGFAHFFEHMMFQGSEHVTDEEHFRLVTEAGGTLNGTTNTDRTNYFQTVPANQLERMLWLEADRMGFFLPAVTQEKFEIQRATVKNERAQNFENRPYGLAFERLSEALYPEGHPYSWQPIGYVEDLDRVDVDDLKAFFLRWYGPNNATLTIGGDFDRAQALAWVAKYFGPIPNGPEVEKPEKLPVSLSADRYVALEDRNITLPVVLMAWPTVHARHDDEAALDVLMSIIGQGETSELYARLVEPGRAVSANTGHACRELHCLFTVQAAPNPASGTSLTDLEAEIRRALAEFEARGVREADLSRVKTRIRAGSIFGLQSVSGKVSQLAYWETLFDTPSLAQAEIDRYEAVTAEDVMRVYHSYIQDRPAAILSVVPEGALDTVAAPANWQRPERVYTASPDEEKATRLMLRTAEHTFDRSQAPLPGPAPVVDVPALWRAALENGVAVTGAQNTETQTTLVRIRIPVGQRDEPLSMLGLAQLTAAMLNESTANRSNADIADALSQLGSSVNVAAGDDYTTVTVSSLTDQLAPTLDIAAEMLFEPGFESADFERLKDQTLESLRSSMRDPSAIASRLRRLLLFGAGNAWAHPNSGREDTLQAIALQDVKAFYEGHFHSGDVEIIAISDLAPDLLIRTLKPFAAWSGKPRRRPPVQPFPELDAGTLYLVDQPGAAQSQIRIMRRGPLYDATGPHYRAGITAFPFGGAFNSRLMLNLREDKGWTYGVNAGFGASDYAGSFTIGAGIIREATADAIAEVFAELETYAGEGMTGEELAFTQRSIGLSEARAYETPGQKAGLIGQITRFDLNHDYRRAQAAVLDAFTTHEAHVIATEWFRPDDMITLVVGDAERIRESLEALGLPIVKLDPNAIPDSDTNK